MARSDGAPIMRSMIGFAASPGTEVLPTCSITESGGNTNKSRSHSTANACGHAASYATISTGSASSIGVVTHALLDDDRRHHGIGDEAFVMRLLVQCPPRFGRRLGTRVIDA